MAPGEISGSIAADCCASARIAMKRCQWACLVEGRERLSWRREAETCTVSMMAEGEMRASSIAVEAETTGTTSVGSDGTTGVAAVISRGRIWSILRFCAARTRSRPSRERARLRLRKLEICAWLNEATPEQHDRLIRWWQDEIEGTGRVPLLSCEQKPEVLRFAGGTDADLRLQWQDALIRMIANAFELPPMLLGMQHDVNRTTAGEMANEAFQSAVVPVAKLLAEHITRDLFAKKLGWREFEFCFNSLESRDEMQEVQIQTALLSAGVLTVDEVRQMRGLARVKAAEEVTQ